MEEAKSLGPEGQEQDDVYKEIVERSRQFFLSERYKEEDKKN